MGSFFTLALQMVFQGFSCNFLETKCTLVSSVIFNILSVVYVYYFLEIFAFGLLQGWILFPFRSQGWFNENLMEGRFRKVLEGRFLEGLFLTFWQFFLTFRLFFFDFLTIFFWLFDYFFDFLEKKLRILRKNWGFWKKMEDFEKKCRGDFGSTWKNIHPWFKYSDLLVTLHHGD